MGVWEKSCQLLRARTVTVEDVSNKGGVELRVLLAASAHQRTWYGRFGYGFGRGGHGTKRSSWKKAAAAASGAPLAPLLSGLH